MSDRRPEVFDQAALEGEAEVLDGVAVLHDAEARPIEPIRAAVALSPAVVQAVAVVGASMVAGAATVAIAQRRRASRSFLVDVHVLGERGR